MYMPQTHMKTYTHTHTQTEPDIRISVEDLLRHPWIMKGHDSPVDWKSKIDVR